MTWWYAVDGGEARGSEPDERRKDPAPRGAARPRADVARPRHRLRQGRARTDPRRRVRLPDHVRRACPGVRRDCPRAVARADRGRRSRCQGLPDRAGVRRGPLHRCVVRVRRARPDARGTRAGGAARRGRRALLARMAAARRLRTGGGRGLRHAPRDGRPDRINGPRGRQPDRVVAGRLDRYESLHWLALAEWLDANPDAPEAEEFRERGRQYKERYLRWIRDLMGWAIFVCRT